MKSVLLYSLLIGMMPGQTFAQVISSDRFILKILDRTVSYEDIHYQLRNLKGLHCVYSDAFVLQYFGMGLIKELEGFIKGFPKSDEDVRRYMHTHEIELKDIRYLFKMLRYSEDQKSDASPKLIKLMRDTVLEEKCDPDLLYGKTLKTNFIALVELELYLRARYGGQVKQGQKFDIIRPSIDLFVESLDKQFAHEYYW